MNTRPKTPEEKRYRKFQMTDLIRQTLDEEAVSSFDFYGRRKDNPHVIETNGRTMGLVHTSCLLNINNSLLPVLYANSKNLIGLHC